MSKRQLININEYKGVENTLRYQNDTHGMILNDIISNYISSENPFSCIRMGNTETYIFHCLYNNLPITSKWHFDIMSTTSGVFPQDVEYYDTYYKKETIECIKNSDIFGWLFHTVPEPSEKLTKDLLEDKVCFTNVCVLDPCVLATRYKNPWTQYLKGKKVLVISSMRETILRQWENIDKVWGEKVDKIAPFELVDVIKSPHAPNVEGGTLYVGDKELKNWMDVKQFLQDEMDNYEYDIVLSGCGAWAPSTVNHAKSRGKSGITLCGNIQLLFGIAGSRWVKRKEGYKEFHMCYNDNWCFPDKKDIPINISLFKIYDKDGCPYNE